jgi:hypothetical protein
MLQSFSMILVIMSCLGSILNARSFFVVDIVQVAHHYFDCSLYPPYQEVYLHGMRKWRSHTFSRTQRLHSWSALQDAELNDPGDNDKKKIWSETKVSEDFEMALRLRVRVSSRLGKTSAFLIAMFDLAQGLHYSVGDLFCSRWHATTN